MEVKILVERNNLRHGHLGKNPKQYQVFFNFPDFSFTKLNLSHTGTFLVHILLMSFDGITAESSLPKICPVKKIKVNSVYTSVFAIYRTAGRKQYALNQK